MDFNYFKIYSLGFKDYLHRVGEPYYEGKDKYIYVFSDPSLCIVAQSGGYKPMYISTAEEMDKMEDIIGSVNMESNNCIFICCCYKWITDRLKAIIEDNRIINGFGCNKILTSEKNEDYYKLQSHEEEFIDRLNEFVDKLEGENNKSELSNDIDTTDKRQVAEAVIKKYDIIMLEDELRINKEGRIYKSYTEADNDDLLIDVLHNSTIRQRKEIFPYIRRYAPKHKLTPNYIAFLNGVYDLETRELKPYTEDMYFTTCIPHNYNKNAVFYAETAKMVDNFFDEITCGDLELQQLLYDIIGYSFYVGNPWQKTFFIYGTGGNGKGTYFNILTSIFGFDKVEYKSWQDLGTATGRYSIIDKSIVLCNDINDNFVKEPQALKTLISCEPQTVKKLYQNEFTAVFRGKIISSGNAIPRVNDTSNGWQRRLILIPFDADFRKNPDVNLTEKLTSEEAIEYMIFIAIISLHKVLKNGFKTPQRVEELIDEYRLSNNPVAQFIEYHRNEYSGSQNFVGKENAKTLDTIYEIYYKNWCNKGMYKPMNKDNFSKAAKAEGLIKTRNRGESSCIYYIE